MKTSHTPTGGNVLDPFCGGGAILVEAVTHDRVAVGRDVNPLAVLISRAKTTPLDRMAVLQQAGQILGCLDKMEHTPSAPEDVLYWYKNEHLRPLMELREAIRVIPENSPMYPFFMVTYSATVRDVTLTYKGEIRLRKIDDDEIARFRTDPIERFSRRVERGAYSIETIPQNAEPDIDTGSVLGLPFRDGEMDAVVCSPPYGDERNGVSYSQFSRNMLSWLGHTQDDVRDAKARTLGWGTHKRAQPTAPTLDRAMENISQYKRAVDEAVAFYADYRDALAEMARVCRGRVVIVVGRRVLKDTVFDNGQITVELMRDLGIDLEEAHERTLPSKRLPHMRKFGAAINKESILVFRV